MGSLFSYSGLTTKIKAMKQNLLKDSQYREMAALDSVAGSVEYLKKQPSYQYIYQPGYQLFFLINFFHFHLSLSYTVSIALLRFLPDTISQTIS